MLLIRGSFDRNGISIVAGCNRLYVSVAPRDRLSSHVVGTVLRSVTRNLTWTLLQRPPLGIGGGTNGSGTIETSPTVENQGGKNEPDSNVARKMSEAPSVLPSRTLSK